MISPSTHALLFNSGTRFPADWPIAELRVSTKPDQNTQTHLGSDFDDFLTEDGLKRCPKCGEVKDRSEFYKHQKTKDGLQYACRECQKARAKTYSKTEAVKASKRWDKLRYKYGMSKQNFQDLLDSQGGRCACCGTETPGGRGNWYVDHCHETGKVRGLLCHHCNTGVGNLGDNLGGLITGMDYMIRTCSTTEEMTPELQTKVAAITLKLQLLLAGVGQ